MHAPDARRVAGLADLPGSGIRFVNRNPGSGTRAWIDAQLRELGIGHEAILGYGDELRTHSEIAHAVASGAADVGLGVRTAAETYDLEFTPLFTERYDLVFDATRTEGEDVVRLLDRLGSKKTRRGIDKLLGYDASHTGEAKRLAI
jgi:molybdate-binding protein